VDKTQSKLIALSVLGLARSLFGKSKMAAFTIDLLTDLVMTRWDEAWDTYTAKNKPLVRAGAKGSEPDPFGAFAECCDELKAAE
jgi:hypothetical protein